MFTKINNLKCSKKNVLLTQTVFFYIAAKGFRSHKNRINTH